MWLQYRPLCVNEVLYDAQREDGDDTKWQDITEGEEGTEYTLANLSDDNVITLRRNASVM